MTNLSIDSNDKRVRIMAAIIDLAAENGIHATLMSKVSKRKTYRFCVFYFWCWLFTISSFI
ncbi:MAG: hypothetical protein CSA42_02495 [Gammaproteobacteria bacterium]|nr:MAG: hypothetical protein CSA42_02495 [Gammaproteobacteria bacterium]